MINMFGKLPGGIQDTAKMAMDAARARQQTRGIIGGGENNGIASVTADNPSLTAGAQSNGAASAAFQVAAANPAAQVNTGINPMVDPLGAASQASYTAAATTPDPINNAISAQQQATVGQVNGNIFMRKQANQGLV
jgi:hypothetical protein